MHNIQYVCSCLCKCIVTVPGAPHRGIFIQITNIIEYVRCQSSIHNNHWQERMFVDKLKACYTACTAGHAMHSKDGAFVWVKYGVERHLPIGKHYRHTIRAQSGNGCCGIRIPLNICTMNGRLWIPRMICYFLCSYSAYPPPSHMLARPPLRYRILLIKTLQIIFSLPRTKIGNDRNYPIILDPDQHQTTRRYMMWCWMVNSKYDSNIISISTNP